jgi:hypothetical protein
MHFIFPIPYINESEIIGNLSTTPDFHRLRDHTESVLIGACLGTSL